VKVIVLAWCPTATSYIDAVVTAGVLPALLVTGPHCPPDGALAVCAARHGVELLRCPNVNAPSFVDRIRTLLPDLLLIAGCSQILRAGLRNTARLGVVNFHPSLLPAYRGKEPHFWVVLQGVTVTGCTVHHVTDDIDAGPILLQREVAVHPRATSASLARDVDTAGAKLIPELLALARTGALPPGRILTEPGTVHPPLRRENGRVDWSRPAIELDRLIRACASEIAAFSYFAGMKLVLLEAEPLATLAQEASPGTIVALGRGTVRIATGSGDLLVRRWLFLDRLHDSEELAERLAMRIGNRLWTTPD
jgi:methionyl-tRNA formyltransferase